MSVFVSFMVKHVVTLLILIPRLACSEGVQYFQFDSQGNLYVFEPGVGCSGPCVKVEPGFEMKEISQISTFSNASVNMASEISEVTSSVTKNEKCSSVSNDTAAKRFVVFYMNILYKY